MLSKRKHFRAVFATLTLLADSVRTTFLAKAETFRPARYLQDAPVNISDGVWTSRGYGVVINVTGGSIAKLEETAISCFPLNELFDEPLEVVEVLDGDVAVAARPSALNPITLDRTDSFHAACANGLTPPMVGDPDYTRNTLEDFDILDQIFVEHYAFFELRDIDWDASTSQARATLTSNSSDEDLLEAFASILDPLEDGHVIIAGNPEDAKSDLPLYSSKPLEILVQLTAEFEQQDAISDPATYIESQQFEWFQIVNSYMDDNGLRGTPDGGFVWGRFNGTNVGYMQVVRGFQTQDQEAFIAELDTAFLNLSNVDAMVVDVRVNAGGVVALALSWFSHFCSERVHVFTTRAVDGDGYTEPIETYIEPAENEATRFDGKVIVIVSGSTISAGELFTLAMTQLPQTTLLGRNTSGAFSHNLFRALPNGWLVGLSNEVVEAPDGTVYEAVGIMPTIFPDAELLPLSEREAGVDSWLELALESATMIPANKVRGSAFQSSWTTQLWWISSSILCAFLFH